MEEGAKPIKWVGSSLGDLREFPSSVRRAMGLALRAAQDGGRHPSARPMEGFKGAGVLKIAEDFDGDTYRAVYTVNFREAVYVLHCFQKKSKQGIATPKQDIDLVKERYRRALEEHKQWQKQNESK
ncbi:MAG: type II toxin-antitoxin system RelE/ParE family toxin [Fimbriimonas sp.]